MASRDSRAMLRLLACRGQVCRERGQYLEAEALYGEALVLAEACLKKNDLEFARLLNDAAVLYKYSGRFDDARRLYLRALRVLNEIFGRRNPVLAGIYHNMGG